MDALQLLEEVGRVDGVDPGVLDRTADALRQATDAEARNRAVDVHAGSPSAPSTAFVVPDARGSAPDRTRPARGRRRRRRALEGTVIVLVVGLAVGLAATLQPGTPGGPTPAAAAVLQKLALVAADQPATPVPGPGQFLFVDSDEAYQNTTVGPGPNGQGSYSVLMPEHRQIWIGPDGSGRLFETFGQPIFLSAQDRADWVTAGRPAISSAPSDTVFGPGGLSLMKLSGLPTDPSALAAEISSRKIEGGPPGAAEDFTQVGDLLRETDATPALRSALYQVAAAIPGVKALGSVTDHSGRPGVAVASVSHGVQDELVFDRQTSALLGEQATVVGPGTPYPVGTVVSWVVYLQSAVVDSTTSTGSTNAPVPLSPSASGAPAPASPSGSTAPAGSAAR